MTQGAARRGRLLHWVPCVPLIITVILSTSQSEGTTQTIVVQGQSQGRSAVTLTRDPETGKRYIQLSGRAMPTIDITCDRKLRIIPLTRSDDQGNRFVGLYEVPQDAVEAMLKAFDCRLFLPGVEIVLPRQQLWAAWSDPSKGKEVHRVLLARVLEVIDGDTIKVAVGDRTEVIRYIGINTPEVHHPTRGAEPGGREATDVNRMLVAGHEIHVELDVQERDRYRRLLAYVYVGETMVNAELVQRGYAQVMTIPPNVRHQELFLKLQREAREEKRGLWADPLERATTPMATTPPVVQAGRPGTLPESTWTCPSSQPIKGNFTTYSGERCIYHVPGGQFYEKTRPERCYASDDEARLDGCRRSRR
jgi:micrococcal nuclease